MPDAPGRISADIAVPRTFVHEFWEIDSRAATLDAILTDLRYSGRRQFSVLLSGPPGSGISSALARVQEQLPGAIHLQGSLMGAEEPYSGIESLLNTAPQGLWGIAEGIREVRAALASISGGTLPLIIVDDAELMDAESMTLLALLSRAGNLQLLVGTHRHRQHAVLLDLMASGFLKHRKLPYLQPHEHTRFVEIILGGPVAPATVAMLRTPGWSSPLLLHAITKHARESERLVLARGVWIPSGKPLELPPELPDLAAAWLVGLLPEERALLELVTQSGGLPFQYIFEAGREQAASELLSRGLLNEEKYDQDLLVSGIPFLTPLLWPLAERGQLHTQEYSQGATEPAMLTAQWEWAASDSVLDTTKSGTAEHDWLRTLNAFMRGGRSEVATYGARLLARLGGESREERAWYQLLLVGIGFARQDGEDFGFSQLLEDQRHSGAPETQLEQELIETGRAIVYAQHGEYNKLPRVEAPEVHMGEPARSRDARVVLSRSVRTALARVGAVAAGDITTALAGWDPKEAFPEQGRVDPLHDLIALCRFEVLVASGLFLAAEDLLNQIRERCPGRESVFGGQTDLLQSVVAQLRRDPARSIMLGNAALAQLERSDPLGFLAFARAGLQQAWEGDLAPVSERVTFDGSLSVNGVSQVFAAGNANLAKEGQRQAQLREIREGFVARENWGPALVIALFEVSAAIHDTKSLKEADKRLEELREATQGLDELVTGPVSEVYAQLLRGLAEQDFGSVRSAIMRSEDLGWSEFSCFLARATEHEQALTPKTGKTTPRQDLTPREEEVARLASEGHSSRIISHRMGITARTVETHLQRAYGKLGVRSRAELNASFGRPHAG